jgi:hypothetical protein
VLAEARILHGHILGLSKLNLKVTKASEVTAIIARLETQQSVLIEKGDNLNGQFCRIAAVYDLIFADASQRRESRARYLVILSVERAIREQPVRLGPFYRKLTYALVLCHMLEYDEAESLLDGLDYSRLSIL